jgi:hypothetical protein
MLGILHYYSHKILPQLVDKYNTIMYNEGVGKEMAPAVLVTPRSLDHRE